MFGVPPGSAWGTPWDAGLEPGRPGRATCQANAPMPCPLFLSLRPVASQVTLFASAGAVPLEQLSESSFLPFFWAVGEFCHFTKNWLIKKGCCFLGGGLTPGSALRNRPRQAPGALMGWRDGWMDAGISCVRGKRQPLCYFSGTLSYPDFQSLVFVPLLQPSYLIFF